MVLKTKTLLLLSSIALLTTPASARTSNELPQLSGRVEFSDFSASRRQAKPHKAKPRQAKPRHIKGRQVAARVDNARTAKRPQAKRYAVRPVPPQVTQYREIGQLEFDQPTVRQQTTRPQAARQPAARRQTVQHQPGFDSYASIPDQHGVSQMYQMSAYHAVVPSHTVSVARNRREARRPPYRMPEQPYNWGGGSAVVAEARRYIGTNPTGHARLWCAHFMNMVLERTGRRGTGSGFARSFANYGTRVSGPQVGAIAVMSRGRNGGHVGVVSGIDPNGNPIIISGNHNRRVAEAVYPRSRIYAYVMP